MMSGQDPDKGVKVRRTRRWLKRITSVKTWQLVIILLLFMLLAAIFLRLNNLGMIERRDAVLAADKSGDTKKLQEAASELQKYISAHMNTYMGERGVALQYTYDRDVAKALASVKEPENLDQKLYARLTESCKPHVSSGWAAYVSCIKAGAGSGTRTLSITQPQLPNERLYYLQFIPPRWSFDAAGISIFICLILIVIIIARLVALLVLKLILKFKYKSA